MKFKYLFLFAALLCTNFAAFGQNNVSLLNIFYHRVNLISTTNSNEVFFLFRKSSDSRFIGSPYLHQEWQNGLVISNDGYAFEVKGRYRIFNDEFHILHNDSVKALFPHLIQGVILGQSTFITAELMTPSGVDHAFFEVLVDGDIKLLKRYQVKVKEVKDDFLRVKSRDCQYYYLRDGEMAQPVNLKKDNILNMMPFHYVKVLEKAKKVNSDNELEMISLFEYCNSL